MAGPLTTIWEAVKTGNLPKSVQAPIWVILISAFGLVIGLGELVCDGGNADCSMKASRR